jgi:hypothetical protein
MESLWAQGGTQVVRLVLSIDKTAVTALDRVGWRPFRGTGLAISFLSVKEGRNRKRQKRRREEEDERGMVRNISLIQLNLQQGTAASRLLTRSVTIKVRHVTNTGTLVSRGPIRGLNIPGYTLFSAGGIDRPRACILARNMTSWMLRGFNCRNVVAVLKMG